jgi:hypothetical protein
MTVHLSEALEILERTPRLLETWFTGLAEPWIRSADAGGEWSPFDIVGHLIHGEKTDWMARARIILAGDPSAVFEVFDRTAQFEAGRGKSLRELLDTFQALRAANLATLRHMDLGPEQLAMRANHPALGPVTLSQLLATWVVHDLAHVSQAARLMARRYREAVGPWRHPDYLRIVADQG